MRDYYDGDKILEQLYADDEALLKEQKDLWGSAVDSDYRQRIDFIGSRRRRVWDKIRRRKVELRSKRNSQP